MAHGQVNGDAIGKQEVGVQARAVKGKGEMDVVAVPYVFRYVSTSSLHVCLLEGDC
jgi:hypothetical protein